MTLQLNDLAGLDSPTPPASGAPLQLEIDLIDEDPGQPRTEFDADSLQDLAATIRERGVRQPVSVREHPVVPGRWMLNFGARRLRASKLASVPHIPAFIDNAADTYDQVIENEQRQGLSPLELALFVQRRLAAGDSQAEIARRLGKSRQYVMVATSLIDPPEWLMSAYREGRCRGLNELHELRKLHAKHPSHVEAWAETNQAFTRERVALLRASLECQSPSPASRLSLRVTPNQPSSGPPSRAAADTSAPAMGRPFPKLPAGPRPALLARVDDVVVHVVTDNIPREAGHVYVQDSGDRPYRAIEASRVTLIGFNDR